jgi:CTP-dependent riboflavin kinase
VAAGSHKYTVKRQGWEPYEGTVNVRSGAQMTIRVNMGG